MTPDAPRHLGTLVVLNYVMAGLSVLGLLMRDFSYEPYGGAMLLGVAGISIIAHGRSSSLAISNAVKQAWTQIDHDLPFKLAASQKS